MIFHSNKISYLASWSKLSKLSPSSNVQFWEELRMYNKLPIALGAALALDLLVLPVVQWPKLRETLLSLGLHSR